MKKKPKSKRKSQHRRPSLSILDKTIYWVALFLSFIAVLLSIYALDDVRSWIAFRDPAVIAHAEHASALFALFLTLYAEISLLTSLMVALEEKKAIFGNPKVHYGQEPWDKDYYPLLDRRRHSVPIPPSEQRLRRKILSLWCAGLLLCLSLAPFSFFGRNCLHTDNSIVSYNAVNRVSATYSQKDFSRLTIQTRYISSYRTSSYWVYEMEIEMYDGQQFSFSNQDFDWRDGNRNDISLDKMLEVKALFLPDAITYKGAENVDKVAEDRGLNESQIRQLHQLFGN